MPDAEPAPELLAGARWSGWYPAIPAAGHRHRLADDGADRDRDISDELASSILPAQAQAYRLQGALVSQETGVPLSITPATRVCPTLAAGGAAQLAAAASCAAEIRLKPPLAGDLGRVERGCGGWRWPTPSADQPGMERPAQRQGPHAPEPEQNRLRSSPGAVRGAEHQPDGGLARRPGVPGPGPQLAGCGLRGHPAGVRARRGRPGCPCWTGARNCPAPASCWIGAGG